MANEQPTNNISAFISAFAGGGVRTNLFQVNGTIPVPGFGGNTAISFLCKAAQIPPSSLGVIEVPYRGRRIKLPGDRTFQDWNITVISDANMSLRSAFEEWSNLFGAHVANVSDPNFMQTLMPNWSVTQLLRDGSPLRTYSFVGCFPTEVGAIDLSFENNDSIAEFSVTLNYSYWIAAPGGAGPVTGNPPPTPLQDGSTTIGNGFGS